MSELHTRNLHVNELHTRSVTVSEPHSSNSSVSEPHTRNLNVSEPQITQSSPNPALALAQPYGSDYTPRRTVTIAKHTT